MTKNISFFKTTFGTVTSVAMYLYVAMVLFVAPVICCHFIGEYARASRKSSDLKEKLENVFASWTITKLCIFHISLIKLKRLNRKYYTNNI